MSAISRGLYIWPWFHPNIKEQGSSDIASRASSSYGKVHEHFRVGKINGRRFSDQDGGPDHQNGLDAGSRSLGLARSGRIYCIDEASARWMAFLEVSHVRCTGKADEAFEYHEEWAKSMRATMPTSLKDYRRRGVGSTPWRFTKSCTSLGSGCALSSKRDGSSRQTRRSILTSQPQSRSA